MAHVSRVDAHRGTARVDCREREPVVEVYVGHERQRGLLHERGEGRRKRDVRQRDARELAARGGEPLRLTQAGREVCEPAFEHALDPYGSAPSNLQSVYRYRASASHFYQPPSPYLL